MEHIKEQENCLQLDRLLTSNETSDNTHSQSNNSGSGKNNNTSISNPTYESDNASSEHDLSANKDKVESGKETDDVEQVAKQIILLIKQKEENSAAELNKLINSHNIWFKDEADCTFLHHAVRSDNKEAVELLLAKQKEKEPKRLEEYINIQNNTGRTALGIAAIKVCKQIFSLLLINDADPNIADNQGYTSVHDATRDLEMFKLVGEKADLTKVTMTGSTVMHCAVAKIFEKHNWAVVKHLLKIPGIKYNQKDKYGRTPEKVLLGLECYDQEFREIVTEILETWTESE